MTFDVRRFYERRLREEWESAGGHVIGSMFYHRLLPGFTGDSRSAWGHLAQMLLHKLRELNGEKGGAMIKLHELADPDSCINRSRDDEPVFVLCARDVVAPRVVDLWADLAQAAGANAAKVASARGLAEAMRNWQTANGHKVPD